jgi:hypothetical protein
MNHLLDEVEALVTRDGEAVDPDDPVDEALDLGVRLLQGRVDEATECSDDLFLQAKTNFADEDVPFRHLR